MESIQTALIFELGGLEVWKLLLFVVVFSVGFFLRRKFSWFVRRVLLTVFGRISPLLRTSIERMDLPLLISARMVIRSDLPHKLRYWRVRMISVK